MPDLPGHGDNPAAGWREAAEMVAGWAAHAGPGVTLVGYSMGGRLGLAAALAHPERLARLILISASPGIADPAARERRRREDGTIADRIERLGLGPFLTEWLARPMFAGLGRRSAAWGNRDLRRRSTNRAEGLAEAVRLLGQGSQPYLGDGVAGLRVPLVAVAGTADEAYVRHAERMAAAAPEGRLVGVRGAGHAVVGEDPGAVASVLLA
jgi:2-succinyl-6-hydroxy-2,4-cyclohexadiene-1-carboxylate synthase